MATEPDLIHQAALAIAADERAHGHVVEVRVDAWVSLNARPAARLIDPRSTSPPNPATPGPTTGSSPRPDLTPSPVGSAPPP